MLCQHFIISLSYKKIKVCLLCVILAERHNGRVKPRKKDSGVAFIYSYMNTEGGSSSGQRIYPVRENILFIQLTVGLPHPVHLQ